MSHRTAEHPGAIPAPRKKNNRAKRRLPHAVSIRNGTFKQVLNSVTTIHPLEFIARFDKNMRYICANYAVEVFFGQASEQIIGKTNTELGMRAAQVKFWESHYKRVFSTGKEETTEFQYTTPSGREYFFTARVVPEFKRGKVDSVMTICRDITARQKDEDALYESEEHFRRIFVEGPIGIATVGHDLRFRKVNAALCKMLGYTETEMARRTVTDITHPDDFSDEREVAGRFLRGELHKYQTEKRYVAKNGQIIWGSAAVSAVRDRRGQFQYFLATIENVNEKKRAEETLQETQRAMLTLMSNLPGMAYRCRNDRNWTMDFVSEGSMDLTGYRPESLIGNRDVTYASLIHPGDRDMVWNEIQAGIRDNRPFQLIYRLMAPGKEEKWVWEQGRGVFSPRGKLCALEGFITDITERKKAEEILKRDKETLEGLVHSTARELLNANIEIEKSKRLSDIGMLASTMAHEMRNPLAAIKTAAYNIQRKVNDPRIEGHLANINRKVAESDLIIQNLLSFSRVKEPHHEPVPVAALLEGCLDAVIPKYVKWNISVEKKLSFKETDTIQADYTHMKILFTNLLDNAIQALTDKTGTVTLAGKFERGHACIEIRDTGSGIDREDLQKVFEPFFTRKSRGTGLGLTICRQIVDLHKGTIKIVSAIGSGTTVNVALPLRTRR